MDDKVKDLIQNLLETKEKIEQNAVLHKQLQIIRSQELEKVKKQFDNKIHSQLENLELEISNKIKEITDIECQFTDERFKKLETKRKKAKYRDRKYEISILVMFSLILIPSININIKFLIVITFMLAIMIILKVQYLLNNDKDTFANIIRSINKIKKLLYTNDVINDIENEPINLLEEQIIKLKGSIEQIKKTNTNNFEDFKKGYNGDDIPEIKEISSKINANSKFLESESRVSNEYQKVDILIKFISYLRNERAMNLKDVFEIHLTEQRHKAEDEFRNKQLLQFESQSKYENEIREKSLEIERQTMWALEAQAQSSMEMVATEQELREISQTSAQLQALSANRDIEPSISRKLSQLEREINNKRDANRSSLEGALFGGSYSRYEQVLKESQKKQSTLDQYESETEKNKVLVGIEKDLEDAIRNIKR